MLGIYKITNKINNKIYIGKSSNIEERWKYHKTRYTYEKDYDKTLYRAFRKYGIENFSFEIIEEMTQSDYNKFANNREEYWITYYDSIKQGYNNTVGGDGGLILAALNKTRKLTEKEVKDIRILYSRCDICLSEAYEFYKDKITKRGFQAVWLGQNYKHIMPEVFSDENKRKHVLIEHQRQGKLRKGKKHNEKLF